jgi:DNA-binding MarR family transcriptional regulator
MAAKSKKVETPTRSTESFRALIRVSGMVRGVMRPYFGRFGISPSQWGALRTLYRTEQRGSPVLRVSDLGDQLLVRPPSVTGLVDRLQRLGLVARNSSSKDLRSKEIQLTQEGRELVERILVRHSDRIAALMAGLAEAEKEQLVLLLNKLATHVESLTDKHEGPFWTGM